MARGALVPQILNLSLGAGLDTKGDTRAADARQMDIARDVQFDELLGAQTRKPMLAMPNSIFGGGTLANCRRVDPVNGELVVQTDTSLYSWNAQQSAWVLRGAQLAVAVTETPRCVTTGDQAQGDRAELNGTVVYAWVENQVVYAAAIDKTTGSVLVSPTIIASAVSRPRVVALSTKILLFTVSNPNNLIVRAIDPATPATGFASGGSNVTAVANGPYDVVKVDSQDLCIGVYQRTTTTSYSVFTVTPALTITTSTKARTADGPLAVSTVPGGGLQTQVVRGNGGAVQGDFLTTSTLADLTVNQALGSVAGSQLTCCYRSVQNGGQFRCYWFATSTVSTTALNVPTTMGGYVDTAGTIGAATSAINQICLASRAFDCNGSVYAWVSFASVTTYSVSGTTVFTGTSLQNSYFLYRDDGFLAAKAVAAAGGGYQVLTGTLPGVTALSATSFAFAASRRRRFDAGISGRSNFAAREPIDVTFTFDSARRAAQLGQTLYVAAGEVLQYDGVQVAEVGFHVFPWRLDFIDTGGGSKTTGATYAYKLGFRWQSGMNESERSTTATIGSITLTGTLVVLTTISGLTVTHKLTPAVNVEVFGTGPNPATDPPFYLVTSNDPAVSANPNPYINNLPSTGSTTPVSPSDALADTAIVKLELSPETGTVLESIAPPAATIVIATDTRLFIAGVAGDPDRVWYSRLRAAGEIAGFNDALTIQIPPGGGAITGLAFLNETLVVFRATSVYALPGIGFDNAGGGQNFGPANRIAADVGAVSMETVALTPMGLVFKSRKGWYLLDRSWGVRYIGAPVAAFDADTVNAVTVVEAQHQVRILSGSRMLVWDYYNATETAPRGQWAEWTIADGVHATMWNGSYVYLTATGPKIEQASYSSLTYGMDVETGWIKLADLQGFGRLWYIGILGEYRSACLVRVRVARDYQYDGAGNVVYFDDKAWTPSPTVVGSALQLRHSPSREQGEAFKVRVTAVTEAVRATMLTTALSPQVTTSGTVWTATWQAAAAYPGEMGNALTMSLAFEDSAGAAFSVDVRDHFAWSHAIQRWIEDIGNVGVRVLCRSGSSPTVAQLEAAIVAGTTLVTLSSADATPSKIVNATGMLNLTATGTLISGAYGSPTGEAIRLTGLALEVGLEPGLYRRLAAGQKQ